MDFEPDWLLTAERAIIYRPTSTAIIADLHLGYTQVRCRNGEALPISSLDGVLAPLRSLQRKHQVRSLVIAGDLFEDGRESSCLIEFRRWLDRASLKLIAVVPGNHDRRPGCEFAGLPVFPEGYFVGNWRIVHGDGPAPAQLYIQGHVHPCVRRRPSINAPCFLLSPRRVVLPAFSKDAAGVNVLNSPLWRSFRCVAVAGERLLDLGPLEGLQHRKLARASLPSK